MHMALRRRDDTQVLLRCGLTVVPRPGLIRTEQDGVAFPARYSGPAKLPTNAWLGEVV